MKFVSAPDDDVCLSGFSQLKTPCNCFSAARSARSHSPSSRNHRHRTYPLPVIPQSPSHIPIARHPAATAPSSRSHCTVIPQSPARTYPSHRHPAATCPSSRSHCPNCKAGNIVQGISNHRTHALTTEGDVLQGRHESPPSLRPSPARTYPLHRHPAAIVPTARQGASCKGSQITARMR